MKCNISTEDDKLRKLCTKKLLKLIDLVREITKEPSEDEEAVKQGGNAK
jgi:hypothetical protein